MSSTFIANILYSVDTTSHLSFTHCQWSEGEHYSPTMPGSVQKIAWSSMSFISRCLRRKEMPRKLNLHFSLDTNSSMVRLVWQLFDYLSNEQPKTKYLTSVKSKQDTYRWDRRGPWRYQGVL